MTVDNLEISSRSAATTSQTHTAPSRRLWWMAAVTIAVVGLIVLLSQLQTGIHDARVANPAAPSPLPQFEWLGLSVTGVWQPVFYLLTIGSAGGMAAYFVRHWRRTRSFHPGAILFGVLFIGLFFDPLFNWAMYVPYDPALLHWPTNWPLVNLVPTVEPLWILVGAYQAFFIAPALAVNALYRRLAARRDARATASGITPDSWITRHPLLTLGLMGFVLGVFFDIVAELWLINIGIYIYSQIPGPYITWGSGHLGLLEIHWTAMQIGLLALLLHRDDGGRSVCTRMAAKVSTFRRLGFGEARTALAVMMTFYVSYFAFYGVLRVGGWANHTPRGWPEPYRAAKTYDPDGRMQKAGVPGPYRSGVWCTGSHCNDN